jgi:hypothetical protein
MSARRLCVLALSAPLIVALPGCMLFDAPDDIVARIEVHALTVTVAPGLDQSSARARVASAASAYVLPSQGDPERLSLRNRRTHEIWLHVDGAVARLDLVSAGGTSPIRHVTQDEQLAREYQQVVFIARRVLLEPVSPAPPPDTGRGPAKRQGTPRKR